MKITLDFNNLGIGFYILMGFLAVLFVFLISYPILDSIAEFNLKRKMDKDKKVKRDGTR